MFFQTIGFVTYKAAGTTIIKYQSKIDLHIFKINILNKKLTIKIPGYMLFWHLNDCFECCDTYELYHKFLLLEQLFLTTLMKPATKFEETKDMYSTGYQYKN